MISSQLRYMLFIGYETIVCHWAPFETISEHSFRNTLTCVFKSKRSSGVLAYDWLFHLKKFWEPLCTQTYAWWCLISVNIHICLQNKQKAVIYHCCVIVWPLSRPVLPLQTASRFTTSFQGRNIIVCIVRHYCFARCAGAPRTWTAGAGECKGNCRRWLWWFSINIDEWHFAAVTARTL